MSTAYMFDTNILSAILRAKDDNPAYVKFNEKLSQNAIFYLCPVALCEFLVGLHNKYSKSLHERFIKLQSILNYIEFIRDDWENAGQLRGQMMSKGRTIEIPDVLIAAQANRLDAIVVTDNTKDFQDTSKYLENWFDTK